jgi:hypothetical protein
VLLSLIYSVTLGGYLNFILNVKLNYIDIKANGYKLCVYNCDQSGRTSKKILVIQFKVSFLDSLDGTEKNIEKVVITTSLLVTKRGPPVCQVRG